MTNKKIYFSIIIPIWICFICFTLFTVSRKRQSKGYDNKIDIFSGEFDIVDNNNRKIGNIILTNDDYLRIEEINGSGYEYINVIDKKYRINSISKKDLKFELIQTKYESFYLCKTQTSAVIITKLHKNKKVYLSNRVKSKKETIYLLSEISIDDYSNMMEMDLPIQVSLFENIEKSFYTCFFIQ